MSRPLPTADTIVFNKSVSYFEKFSLPSFLVPKTIFDMIKRILLQFLTENLGDLETRRFR
jgi:hypothetical protein